MLLWRREKYKIKNKDEIMEEHYSEYHLTFRSKNQTPWIMLIREDYCRIFVGGNVIWSSK